MDLEALDPVSRELVRQLRRSLPQVRRALAAEARPGERGEYLFARLPRPTGDGIALVIDAGDPGRVRVALGRWSMEFDCPPEGGRHTELPQALDAIEDLIEGRATAYLLSAGGRPVDSGLLRDERDEAALLGRLAPGRRIELFSFDGEGDAVYER